MELDKEPLWVWQACPIPGFGSSGPLPSCRHPWTHDSQPVLLCGAGEVVNEVRGARSESGALGTARHRIHDLPAGASFGQKMPPMKEARGTWIRRKRKPASKLTVTLN